MKKLFFSLLILLAGCGPVTGTISDLSQIHKLDLQEAQILVGALNTAVSVVKAEDETDASASIAKTIGAWNTPATFPATPAALYADDTYRPGNRPFARYPAVNDYLNNFYGQKGNLAYLEMRQSTDGWGDYQVKLFIHPTLSTEVKETVETYRVPSNDWTALIDRITGVHSAIGFESIETQYFDRRTESRTPVWTRWVDGQVFPKEVFAIPSDFSSPDFDYPAVIIVLAKRAAADAGGKEEYSSHNVFQVTSPLTDCDSPGRGRSYCVREEKGTEFYSELLNSAAKVEIYSKSYSTKQIEYDSGITMLFRTVRFYTIDDLGKKTVRAKTFQTVVENNRDIENVITEEEHTGDTDGNGRINFSRVEESTQSGSENIPQHLSFNYRSVLEVEETGVEANTYEGILTETYPDRTVIYDVFIHPLNGLKMHRRQITTSQSLLASANQETDFTFRSFSHTDELTDNPAYNFTLSFGSLTGSMEGGIFQGTYKNRSGETSTLILGDGFVILENE